jgi:hypothetical protein
VAAYLHSAQPDETLAKLKSVVARLEDAKVKALGKEWVQSWWKGLLKAKKSKFHIEHNQIVWIHNCIKTFGMYEFGTNRYNSFEKNGEKWDDSLPFEKNVEKIGRNAWGFVPGLPLRPGVNYEDDFADVPAENLARVKEAEAFVYTWCHSEKPDEEKEAALAAKMSFIKRTFSVSTQMLRMTSFNKESSEKISDEKSSNDKANCDPIPAEWKAAYDMKPWPDFPDRPSRG